MFMDLTLIFCLASDEIVRCVAHFSLSRFAARQVMRGDRFGPKARLEWNRGLRCLVASVGLASRGYLSFPGASGLEQLADGSFKQSIEVDSKTLELAVLQHVRDLR